MRGRRAWVLLLLAAVFTMHGLQCAATDGGAPAGAHGPVVHAVAASDPVAHLVGFGAAVASAKDMPSTAVMSAAMVGVPDGAGHDSRPHGSGHLWAWCLAVLAAGLAVLLLALAGRPPETKLPLPRRITVRGWDWLSPPRPPDLYSLCLMRI